MKLNELETPEDEHIEAVLQGLVYDTRKSKKRCERSFFCAGRQPGSSNDLFKVALYETGNGDYFFVECRKSNGGAKIIKAYSTDDYKLPYNHTTAGYLPRVEEFVLLCTPEEYKYREGEWVTFVLGITLPEA